MVSLVILFMVIVATVNSIPIQELEGILEMLEKPQKQEIIKRKERENNRATSSFSSDDDSNYDDESDDNDDSISRALRNTDVIDFIRKASRDKDDNNYNFRTSEDRKSQINGIPVYSKAYNRDDRDVLNKKKLEQLLQDRSQIKNMNLQRKLTEKRLAANDLLSPYELKVYDEDEKTADLSNYSKIYIVLNPLAIRQSNSEGAVNNLISKILTMVSSTNGRKEKSKRYHEGIESFLNNAYLSRRGSRDSNEIYSPRDSIEDYKPKRLRKEHSGGSGRTAIPYIRHRGDIYERDN